MLHSKLRGCDSAHHLSLTGEGFTVGPRIPSTMQILISGYLEYVKLSLKQEGYSFSRIWQCR